jgi:hypothetical protein
VEASRKKKKKEEEAGPHDLLVLVFLPLLVRVSNKSWR